MKYFIYLILIMLFSACEFEIHPELAAPEEVLVIDAFLTDKQETQTINITRSQPYFETTRPEKVTGLTVRLEDLTSGNAYTFLEGEEHYYLEVTSPIAIVGHTYRLEVEGDEASFEAFATMKRVPPIDSIGFEYNEPNFLVDQNHFTAQFYAVDPKGVGDCYWIKGWKNGIYFNKPEELNMAYDASVSPGQPIDGQLFVFPVRAGFINPYGNDDDPESTDMVPPYEVGDSLYVEIHSIDRAAFDFLYALYFQINRPGGFGEIFSSPLSNVSTNIRNMNPTSSINVAGFFSMSAVSASGRKLTEEIAHEVKTKYFNQ
ncbi:DUF4249 domain-containing protein [Marinoscillum sp.]|uniref:DUF4249 domain-containing protein n=1 Tax=Marinoscillum sp. TaxID=2024838 RepID=UPI003BAA4124